MSDFSTCGMCKYGRAMFIKVNKKDKRVICGAPLLTNGFIMQHDTQEKEQCKKYKENQ